MKRDILREMFQKYAYNETITAIKQKNAKYEAKLKTLTPEK